MNMARVEIDGKVYEGNLITMKGRSIAVLYKDGTTLFDFFNPMAIITVGYPDQFNQHHTITGQLKV